MNYNRMSFLLNVICSVVLLLLLTTVIIVSNVYAQQEVTQLPSLNSENVHIIEKKSYCFVGIGSQNMVFKIGEKEVHSDSYDSVFVPVFNLFNSPYISLGCTINKIVMNYSYYENSIRFNENVEYKGIVYNVADFSNNNLSVGYSFSLIPHYLHFDTGVGYSQIQYELDYVSSGSIRGENSADLNSSGTFGFIELKWFLTSYLYLHWLNQSALTDSNVVSYLNQLGLHFLVRL